MRWECHRDPRAVARRAADLLTELVAANGAARILVPAGASPVPLYRELAVRRRGGRFPCDRCHFVQLDELLEVSGADPQSFQCFLVEHLLDPLAVGAERRHLIDGAAADPHAEIGRHAARLSDLGGADLALLGVGRNGHIAFNEPGTLRGAPARVVQLAAATRAGLAAAYPASEPPRRGLTLGLAEILAARRVCLIVTGAAKAGILARLRDEGPGAHLPVSFVKAHHHALLLADRAAWAPRAAEDAEAHA